MRDKKRVLCFTGIIAIIGLAIFTFLEFRCYTAFYSVLEKVFRSKTRMLQWKDYLIVISSGIFTSAIVTILVTTVDYLDARYKALEKVYLAAEDLEHAFAKIKYIFPDEPRELVKNLFCEIDGNDINQEINQQLLDGLKSLDDSDSKEKYENLFLPIEKEAREKFKEYLWEHNQESIKSRFTLEADRQAYLEVNCDEKIKKYAEQIEQAIQSYLVFDSIRTRELSAAYGELDFFTKRGQKNIRNHIYDNLYIKLVKQVNAIKKANFHFNLYTAGKAGNRGVMLDFIWKLQDMLVSEDDNFYYRQFMFDIDMQMVQVLIFSSGINKHKDEFPDKKRYMITAKIGAVERIMAEAQKK